MPRQMATHQPQTINNRTSICMIQQTQSAHSSQAHSRLTLGSFSGPLTDYRANLLRFARNANTASNRALTESQTGHISIMSIHQNDRLGMLPEVLPREPGYPPIYPVPGISIRGILPEYTGTVTPVSAPR
jgi:hypothetical protein